jgi:hypothetical protein
MSVHTKEPPDPQGSSSEAVFLRSLKQWVKSFELGTIIGGRKIPKANGGFDVVIDFPKSGTTAGGKGKFRGEWSAAVSYALQDEVVISTGLNMGTYVYVNAAPSAANQPWVGGGFWVQKPGGLYSQWM